MIYASCLFLWFIGPFAANGSTEFEENQIKAAFLYNFANFVEWPSSAFPNARAPIVLGVFGKKNLVEILNSATLRPIRGREVIAKPCERLTDLNECHVLFIDRSKADDLQKILERIKDKSILTVSDMENFAQKGGIINFIEKDSQIRFAINAQAARRSKLSVSSKLLNLALTVFGVSP